MRIDTPGIDLIEYASTAKLARKVAELVMEQIGYDEIEIARLAGTVARCLVEIRRVRDERPDFTYDAAAVLGAVGLNEENES